MKLTKPGQELTTKSSDPEAVNLYRKDSIRLVFWHGDRATDQLKHIHDD